MSLPLVVLLLQAFIFRFQKGCTFFLSSAELLMWSFFATCREDTVDRLPLIIAHGLGKVYASPNTF
jgi:hypothetical protein